MSRISKLLAKYFENACDGNPDTPIPQMSRRRNIGSSYPYY